MISGEKIIEGICEQIKIIEDRTTEEDIDKVIGMIIMKEAEVGLEKDSLQMILEGMTEGVVVDLDQV